MKRWLAGLALVTSIALTSVTPARAADQEAAQALFEEGRRLMAANQFAEACPKFAESQRLDPGAGTLLNLGLCYEKNDQLASAWITYTQAAEDADRSGRPEWVKRARDKVAAITPHLASITISVPKNARVEGLEVTRDGEKVGAAVYGVKVPVDGGEHVIAAAAPNRESWTHTVKAPARDANLVVAVPVLPIRATPAPVVAATPVTKRPEKTKSSFGTQRTVGVVAGAIGIVGLGIGGAFAIRAAGKHSDAQKDCNSAETYCGANGLSNYGAAKGSANIATVGVIAGAALLVGGVILYLTAPKNPILTAATRGIQF